MTSFSTQLGEAFGRFWRRLMEPRLDRLEVKMTEGFDAVRKDVAEMKESLASDPFDLQAFDRGLEAAMESPQPATTAETPKEAA